MATASSIIAGDSHEVGPIPGALYTATSLATDSGMWPLDMPKLVPGQWTILIINEYRHYAPNKTRYALISPVAEHGNTKYRVIDMETYLCMVMHGSKTENVTETARLRDHWLKNGEGLTHFAEVQESEEVMQVLEKEVAFARSGTDFQRFFGLQK